MLLYNKNYCHFQQFAYTFNVSLERIWKILTISYFLNILSALVLFESMAVGINSRLLALKYARRSCGFIGNIRNDFLDFWEQMLSFVKENA